MRAAAAGHVLYLPLPTVQNREELVRSALHRVCGYSAHPLEQASGTLGQAAVATVKAGVASLERMSNDASALDDYDGLSNCSMERVRALAQETDGFTLGEILLELRAQIVSVFPRPFNKIPYFID